MYIIIGASSYIGRHLYRYCERNEIDVLGTYYTHSYDNKWVRFNLYKDNLDALCRKYLEGRRPDAVIICSANANIDSCKRNEYTSNLLNVVDTKRILDEANSMGIKSVFLSSEAVFDGRTGMYTEVDIPNPPTLYGNQKLQIEQYLLQNMNDFLIFRISRAVSSNFGEKDIFGEFYSKIKNQEAIVCLKEQSFCLTEVNDIAQCIVGALKSDVRGLYHLSSDNCISRYDIAKLYAERIFGGYDKILEKDYDDIPFLDKRHIHGGLNGSKLAGLLGFHYMNTDEILYRYAYTYERSKHE